MVGGVGAGWWPAREGGSGECGRDNAFLPGPLFLSLEVCPPGSQSSFFSPRCPGPSLSRSPVPRPVTGGAAAEGPGRRLLAWPLRASRPGLHSHDPGQETSASRAAAGPFDGQDRVLVVSFLRPGCARHVPLRCWPHRPLMLQRPSGIRPAFRGKEELDGCGAACARWQATRREVVTRPSPLLPRGRGRDSSIIYAQPLPCSSPAGPGRYRDHRMTRRAQRPLGADARPSRRCSFAPSLGPRAQPIPDVTQCRRPFCVWRCLPCARHSMRRGVIFAAAMHRRYA